MRIKIDENAFKGLCANAKIWAKRGVNLSLECREGIFWVQIDPFTQRGEQYARALFVNLGKPNNVFSNFTKKDGTPTQQEISDCIAYFKEKGVYAYEHNNCVLLDFDNDFGGIGVEISNDEIIERAELYREERSDNATISSTNAKPNA